MSKVYVCDLCGKQISDPYSAKMKEFHFGGTWDLAKPLREKVETEKEIHLCDNCFHILHLVEEGNATPPEENKVIRIKYLSDNVPPLTYVDGKSDWIDLYAAEDVTMSKDEFKLIPLGIAVQLPEGFEAHIIPRSSTFKNFGVIQANHMGLIDESYCGDNDQWFFPAIALRDTEIHAGDRICQFRIVAHQPPVEFDAVDTLGNEDRGGLGSTGVK